MKKYEFNIYGICINPDKISIVGGTCIYVAQSKVSGWVYGFKWETDNKQNGGGYAPSIQHLEKDIKSKREAVIQAIKALRNIAARESRQGFGVQGINECCNKAFDEVNQTSLF